MLLATRPGYIAHVLGAGSSSLGLGVWSELPAPIFLSGTLQPPGSERLTSEIPSLKKQITKASSRSKNTAARRKRARRPPR